VCVCVYIYIYIMRSIAYICVYIDSNGGMMFFKLVTFLQEK
jgi:hypothetical protein